MVRDDTYRPHTLAELEALVEEGVLSRDVISHRDFDPDEAHAVWWCNQLKVTKNYRDDNKRRKFTKNPRSEWVAVPVPLGRDFETTYHARATVDAARKRIEGNVWVPSNGGRELSGLLSCECGKPATTNTKKGGKYRYYVCGPYLREGRRGCEHGKHLRAEPLEERVRGFVLSLLEDPDALREKVLEQLEAERRDAGRDRLDHETRGLLQTIEEADKEGRGYLRQNTRGVLPDADLDAFLGEVNDRRAAAQRGLDALKERREAADRIEEYAALLDEYLRDLPYLIGEAGLGLREYETVPAGRTETNPLGIYTLTPERVRERTPEEMEELRRGDERKRAERFRWAYEMLGLRVVVDGNTDLGVTWSFGEDGARLLAREEPTQTRRSRATPLAPRRPCLPLLQTPP